MEPLPIIPKKEKKQKPTDPRVKFNEKFFSTWSANMAYVLGLFYTDGDLFPNLSKSKSTQPFYVRLYSNDKSFLQKILTEMKGNAKIGMYKKSIFKITTGQEVTRGELYFFHIGKQKF